MEKFVARDRELQILKKLYASKEAEFLAVYGRRRVGKTILIDSFCKAQKGVYFSVSGTQGAPLFDQLANFIDRMSETFYHGAKLQSVTNWREAFKALNLAFSTVPENQTILLFFDEFPWLATKNSRLLQHIDYYWNQYWSKDKRIKLIICGSSASWIINKIIRNKGGLHNRVTQEIHLQPFTLFETNIYLEHHGIKLSKKQVVEIYMALGGIPYYLRRLQKGLSATQNIEHMAFQRSSFLLEEFDKLYDSLFDGGEVYIEIMRLITQKRYGVSQTELIKNIEGMTQGGEAKKKLQALEDAGFIMRFKPYAHSKKGIYFRVIDEYTLFYFRWIEPVRKSLQSKAFKQGYWAEMVNSPAWHAWASLAFEAVCYKHLAQISTALKLPATALADCWQFIPKSGEVEEGAQIDLLFDRRDDVITLCEIKYTNQIYTIDKQYAKTLQSKLEIFQKRTKTKKTLMLVMISANGVKENMYSEELITDVVTLEGLFIA